MRLRIIIMRKLVFLAFVVLAFSCGVKEKDSTSVEDVIHFRRLQSDTYIHLENDTLSQICFTIGWGLGHHQILVMNISNTIYSFYQKRGVKNPKINGLNINNYYCCPTRKTLQEMSAILCKMKEKYRIDSLSYIFLSTEDVLDTGIEMSAILTKKKGIYKKDVEEAIRQTTLEREVNKILKPYNLFVSKITTDWDCKPLSSTLERFPIRELGLKFSSHLPKSFVIMPLRIELTTIHGKGPRHIQ